MPVVIFIYFRYFYCMKTVFAFIVVLVFSHGAFASVWNGANIGVGVSVFGGIDAFAGFRDLSGTSWWQRHLGGRIGYASTNPLKSAIDSAIDSMMRDGVDVGDGVRIDNGKLDAWHTMFMLDYYPFGGAWRVSGGYTWGALDLTTDIFGSISGAPSQRFYFYLNGDHYYYNGNDFNGHTYINWDYHGPYIGTGFDIGNLCGFGFFIDVGVVFASHPAQMSIDIPHQQLYIYDSDSDAWSPVTIPALDQDVAQATHDANRKLSDFQVLPMVKIGFLYRF